MIPFALFLKLICFGQCTGITFIDSTKMAVCKKLSGKLYGDKGYISAALCELLFEDGLHLVTGIKP